LGSANGTLFNNERIHEPTLLRDGDEISVGDVVFTFHDPDTTVRENPSTEIDVDEGAAIVRVNRKIVELSPKEFALIAYLFAHEGQVCAKDDIAQAVWSDYQSGVYDYQIENLIRRVRAKIEPEAETPKLLFTVRGRGYKLVRRG
jgi:DNA-binding response OmpR family regulator